MKNAIITGAAGFVGRHTVDEFLAQGIEVLAVGRGECPAGFSERAGLSYLRCDVREQQSLLEAIPRGRYDTFVHLAWAGSAGGQRADCALQMENAITAAECVKAAKALGCQRFVCAGSIMEAEVEAAVHTQGSRPALPYIYGMGKLASHCFCKAVAADVGIDLVWCVITNAYGAGELSPRFINTTLRKMIKGEPLTFTAATQNYDFVYITEVARALYQASCNGKPFFEYVIGSGKARPLKEYILQMRDVCAPKSVPQFGSVPFTGTSLPLEAFSIEQLAADTGFAPQVSFAEGVAKTAKWLCDIDGRKEEMDNARL